MARNGGLTRAQIVLLSAITSALMAVAVSIGQQATILGIPPWVVYIFAMSSTIAVVFRDAYATRNSRSTGAPA